MASSKYLELKEFSNEDLVNELAQSKVQYQKMKFDHAIRGLENPLSLREVRRDIARISTELRSREIAEVDGTERTKIRARRRNK